MLQRAPPDRVVMLPRAPGGDEAMRCPDVNACGGFRIAVASSYTAFVPIKDDHQHEMGMGCWTSC